MNCANKCIAIKALAALMLSGTCALAWAAQVVGTVVNLSGLLMVQKEDGAMKVLAVKSEVEEGDTLVSEKNTYAQIKFVDDSEITLRPNTTFKIEAFAYDEAKPDADNASFNLLEGGVRSVTGLLGKRNREKFLLKTPTAAINIHGTTFVAQYVNSNAGVSGPNTGSGLPPGLHLFVLDGLISISNIGGSQNFSAGQFGFVPSFRQPPLIVPVNPALKFTPPPVFSLVQGNALPASSVKVDTVDCEVR